MALQILIPAEIDWAINFQQLIKKSLFGQIISEAILQRCWQNFFNRCSFFFLSGPKLKCFFRSLTRPLKSRSAQFAALTSSWTLITRSSEKLLRDCYNSLMTTIDPDNWTKNYKSYNFIMPIFKWKNIIDYSLLGQISNFLLILVILVALLYTCTKPCRIL